MQEIREIRYNNKSLNTRNCRFAIAMNPKTTVLPAYLRSESTRVDVRNVKTNTAQNAHFLLQCVFSVSMDISYQRKDAQKRV